MDQCDTKIDLVKYVSVFFCLSVTYISMSIDFAL